MFGTLRKHSQPLWIAIIIVVVISFVVFFTPNFDPFQAGGGSTSADAAAVQQARNEVLIDEIVEQRQRQLLVKMYMRAGRTQEALKMAGGNYQQLIALMQDTSVLANASASRIAGNSQYIDLNGDDYNDINSLEYNARIRLRQLAVAGQLGIVISDNAVNAERSYVVQNLHGVQEYSVDLYEQTLDELAKGGFISGGHAGQDQFEQYLRSRLLLQQLTDIMSRSAGFWPDSDQASRYADQNREYAVEAAFISLTNHTARPLDYPDIAKAEGFTNHFNQVADQYHVPVRHTIAYVKFDLADYEADILKATEFDKLVQDRIDEHNTSTNKLTDINGTAAPNNATNLLQLAQDEVRSGPVGTRIFKASNSAAQEKSTEFLRAVFKAKPWSTTNLWAAAKQSDLEVHTITLNRKEPPKDFPAKVVNEAFSPSLKPGKLLESAVKTTESHFILGLQDIIPLQRRGYDELDEDEQQEVHDSFLESETRRLASEAGESFRAGALATLKEGRTFTHAATNVGLQVVSLPAFGLNAPASTNHIDLLKDFVPLRTLQSALVQHEQTQLSKADDQKDNLTGYLEHASGAGVSFNDTIAGYVLHITERKEGEAPDARELHSYADRLRQDIRNRYARNDWFEGHIRQLNAEIIISSLTERKNGIASEIREVEENVLYKENVLTQNFTAALQQAGIPPTDPAANTFAGWDEKKVGTLKTYVREQCFAEPVKNTQVAAVIVPLLSGAMREHWADLAEKMADLDKLKALRDGGLDQAIEAAKADAAQ